MKYFGIFILLIISLFILFYNSDKPFVGHHDWNGVVYSNIARNYNRYGFLSTKFGQVRNYDITVPSEFGYFTHYPPLLPIFMALSFGVFGESEVSARLVPIMASVGMLLILYLIGKEIKNYLVGLIAVSLTIATSLFMYFGKLPVHETVLPFFVLLVVYFYVRFYKTKSLTVYILLILSLITAEFVSWPGYYIVPPLIFHTLYFIKDKSIRNRIFLLFPLSILSFSIHLFHVYILTGLLFGGGLLDVFVFRANPYQSADIYSFTIVKFLTTELRYFLIYMTKPLLFLSFLWVIYYGFKAIKKELTINQGIVFVLLIFGFTHITLFTNMAFIHDYMIYYSLPFFTLSGAWVLGNLSEKPKILIPLTAVIIFLMLWERFPYTKELLKTHASQRGYELGTFIRRNTRSQDTVFIGSNSYKEFDEVFLGYYADRNITYGEERLQNPYQYSLIVRPKDHDALIEEIKNKLDQDFKREENEKYIWYKSK